MSSHNVYNNDFYSNQKNGSLLSAEVVVPIILEYFPDTKSVIDFGCGVGTWLSVFNQNGIEIIHGLDGEYVLKNELLIENNNFQPSDLKNEIKLENKYDIALSLEVAEHIPEDRAETFVDNLVNSSNIIVFSAAIPGQGGDDHINEQWQSYWISKFEKRGFTLKGDLKDKIWNNDNVEFWYAQNINIFIKNTIIKNHSHLINNSSSLRDIVHPKQLDLVLQRPPEEDILYFTQTLKLLFKVFLKSIRNRV